MFTIWLFLARLGFFTYRGLLSAAPAWWPRARVYYPDAGQWTRPMAIGNAVEYASMSEGARVEPA